MRKSILCFMMLVALCVSAQVTTDPAIIEPGYTGKITITFDPTKGNGGMVGATQCYAHNGYCTEKSNWLGVIGSWRGSTQPQLTKVGDKWQLEINNMYDFYKISSSTEVKALAFVFHDGPGGSKEGKTAAGGDIFLFIGEDNSQADIWDNFTPAAVTTAARPSGISQGIYYDPADPTKVTLCTYAGSKTEPAKHVFVVGDMTNWKLSNDYQMKRDGFYFWLTINDLEPGKEYRFQYAIERADGVKKQISDIYSEKVIHPDDRWEPKSVDPTLIDYPLRGADGGYVTVIQTNKPAYEWSDATLNFKRPDRNNLVIYELWVYDYTPYRCFKGLLARLDYLKQLGVNAIELMPITEFEGNKSWGYNPNHYFAIDKAYGTPDQLRQLVDECHQRGIAVILDMVFNHTNGLNPMAKLYPWGDDLKLNPWFIEPNKVPHDDNDYCEDWNHDFEPAHEMFTRVFQYWLKEFKVDGFRLDLSHGLCGPTYNAVENLTDYFNKGVKAVAPDAYLILEHWGSKSGSDRPKLIEQGMLCWMNTNNAYCQVAMGWLKDGDGLSDANKDGYVTYCESHDEERMQYKCKEWGNGAVKTDEAVRLGRVPACVAMNVLLNGTHMLWQFEEIGYDFSINSSLEKPYSTSGGRVDPKPRPENSGYFKNPYRIDAYVKCAQAIQLRTQIMPEVFAGNPTAQVIGSGAKVRYVQWSSDVYVVANFDIADQTATLPSGNWYDYYAGGTQASGNISLKAGEVKIYTGKQVELPKISRDLESLLPVENVQVENVQSTKVLRNGQILIIRGDKVYDLTGRRVE
jgi:hypothetical protein